MVYSLISQDWPGTDGVVISSEVEERYRGMSGLGRKEYVPRVWFIYRVGPDKFISKSLSLVEDCFGNKKTALNVVRAYPKGAKITVKYNRLHPVQAFVRDSELSSWEVFRAGEGVFFVFCGFVAFMNLLSRGKKS